MRTLSAIGLQLLILALLAGVCLAQGPAGHPKMSSAVAAAARAAERHQETLPQQAPGRSPADSTATLRVYIEMNEVSEATLAKLRALGASIELTDPRRRILQARVPTARLEAIASLPGVRFLRLPDYGIHNRQGSAGTEGDAVVRAHLRRLQLGATGAGVSIGVISEGVNGLAASIASGDLPSSGIRMPASPLFGIGVSLDGPLPGAAAFSDVPADRPDLAAGSEGRALLEIIHDIAPGARLFLAPVDTSLSNLRAVEWMRSQGVQVIADDIVFLNVGPYDGTSDVSQAAASAAASGIAYFQAVGNFADQHYHGPFTDRDGDGFQDFDASLGQPRVDSAGETLNVTVPADGTLLVFLQWDDPFGASANDYDVCIDDPADSTESQVACSLDFQTGTQDPTEFLVYTPSAAAPVTVGIQIIRTGTAAPRVFDLFVVGARMDEFIVPEGSIPNKADAGGGVISVGAVDWLVPGAIEAFSSRGPTRDGRMKPELVAPDGVSTSLPDFAPFFGTSAAAPHAAAAWALALGQNPELGSAQLPDLLAATAVDLGPPGPDDTYGFGRLDAFPEAPRGMLSLDRSVYRTGDTLRLRATLQPGSTLNSGDAYVFALLPPDEASVFSLTSTLNGAVAGADGFEPLASGLSASAFSGEIFEYTFSGNEPAGLYRVFDTLAFPGESGVSPTAEDLDATIFFDGTVFEFSP